MIRRTFSLLLIFLVPQFAIPQSSVPRDAAEIRLALKKLTVLGSVLYIGAHPDDENTAILATLAQERCYRTAYLSITRGEGGQNLLGPEQGEMLGLIRTQELLAARRIDGAEQFFTRAIDFGFSKTPEETLRFWGKEKTLADVVWIIRTFRPDVIITRFTPTLGGHGNHTASAILADEAFRAAADPSRFPEQLQFTSPWQAKRIVWNGFRPLQTDTLRNAPPTVTMDVGSYSPLLGKSFTEIAGEGRTMHKSQGMGAGQNRGESSNYFQYVDGDTAAKDLFDGINTGWSRVYGAETAGIILDEASRTFDDTAPEKSIPKLFNALNLLNTLPPDPWCSVKKENITQAILSCAGVWIDAVTPENAASPGGEVKFAATIINRTSYPFLLERLTLPFGGADTLLRTQLERNKPVRSMFTVRLPDQINESQPYWLREKPGTGSYAVSNQLLVGQPENVPPVMITLHLSSPDGKLSVTFPLRQRVIDPIDGELLRPFEIVPPVIINVQNPIVLFPDLSERKISISLKSSISNARGIARLRLPDFWAAVPEHYEFQLKNKGDEQTFTFSVHPLKSAVSGIFSGEVEIGKTIINRSIQTAQYKHIPPQTIFPPAEGKLLKADLRKTGSTAGYLMGAGDEVPAAIRQMGFSVALLSDAEIAEGNLDRFDVIVAGVRAYNTRPLLRLHQERLMDYVKRGGTYIVQYVSPQRNEAENVGPYPLTISRSRVAEEDARISFLNRNHPVMTTPNKISDEDFNGWIQERGLYFADRWDAKYDSVLSCHDTNEPDRAGGLLTAHYGKGYYVFCAYAFFRQLPAGVEGAYRLFANILSLHGDRRRSTKTGSR
ncbi:MAG: PIG-L family deacetylase [Ignavibacteriae bacterium]|nr:MAG: PIG-L family deacetylase [Ignavibacteriota bacterium]